MKKRLKRHTIVHYFLTVFVYLIKGLIGEFIWLLIGLSGYLFFQTMRSPFDLVIGLPLIVISIGFIFNSLWSELLAIFSPIYNKGVCAICNPGKI
jgi:hypothetical protein